MGIGEEDEAVVDTEVVIGAGLVAVRSVISTSIEDETALLGRTGIDFGDTAGEAFAEVLFKGKEVI